MKKLMTLALIAICVTLTSNFVKASANETLKGTWEYKVPAAPYDYSTGKITFAEKEGKTTATVLFMNGTELKVQDLKVESNSFSFSVDIENNLVKVNAKITNGKITGKVDSPQGLMDFTAEQPKRPAK